MSTETTTPEPHYELGRAYAVAAVLAMAAEGEIKHKTDRCPSARHPTKRNARCPVCRALVEWDALKADVNGGRA